MGSFWIIGTFFDVVEDSIYRLFRIISCNRTLDVGEKFSVMLNSLGYVRIALDISQLYALYRIVPPYTPA